MMEIPAVTQGLCSMFTQDAHLSQPPTLVNSYTRGASTFCKAPAPEAVTTQEV